MKNCQGKKEHKKFNKIFFTFFIFCFCSSFLFSSTNITKAAPDAVSGGGAGGVSGAGDYIKVGDQYVLKSSWEGRVQQMKDWAANTEMWGGQWLWEKGGSVAFWSAIKTALNTIAYDTATWLASGGEGQKPMFITEGWGEYLTNVADNSAGAFIESLGSSNDWGVDFNLCEPDSDIKSKIGLGLYQYAKPSEPECTFSEMKENWEEELQSDDFLTKFQDMFDPVSNDLGIALSLQTGMIKNINVDTEEAGLYREEGDGWLDVSGIAGDRTSPPGHATSKLEQAKRVREAGFLQNTEDAFEDAANIFLNQLAVTLFNKLLESLAEDSSSYTSPYDWSSLSLSNASSQSGSGGIAAAKDRFKSLIEPSFNVRGDYDILSELTMCPDPTKAGPTNCVITDNFRQAIISRMTVGDAMDQGYLDANGIFGFTSDGLEPDYYDKGYPYRSMVILRKFRIIPAGWEVAAQYINDFSSQTLNLGDLVACYDSADDYEGYFASWCKGLVDPSWVLKAPLNYCKREGPGPEIISEQVMGDGTDSELSVMRDGNYCADEQSCIKENDDGSCQLYGYCVEERRKWLFNGESCEPRYNTCETFRGREGGTASYLENTLDYGLCGIDNVGCQAYCADYDYSAGDWECTSSTGNKIYFDKDAEECDSDDEGCHEFIRTKPGLGANLLTNSSFEDDLTGTIWEGGGIRVNDGYDGGKGLQLSAYLSKTIAIGPADYSISGEAYSLSFYAKDCSAGDTFKIIGQSSGSNINSGSNWQYYQTAHVFSKSSSGNVITFEINSTACIIDAVKLERSIGIAATTYSGYRAVGLIYEKLLPEYLEDECYVNSASNYQYKSGAPGECYDFARKCNQGEVGCELYTSVSDRTEVPAKVTALDYCPSECAGYDVYIQGETTFDSLRDAYFIPATAQTCGAAQAGCDEFTNLDEVSMGGEAIEHYTYLRQCVKPSDPAANCSEFYAWEGSDETGYQLKVFNLQTDGEGAAAEPELTEDDSLECGSAIYALSSTDPAYNSDCRELYNRDGGVSYHLYTRTISCSADCRPYRRTEVNTDPLIADALSCIGDDKHWDSASETCAVCKNSGYWSDQHGACLYDAIPDEGTECSAGDNGCREYSGNTGNNIMVLMIDNFEDGTNENWAGEGGTSVANSNESIIAGGHSLLVSGGTYSAAKEIGLIVDNSKSYMLSFIAKTNSSAMLSAGLRSGAGDTTDFGQVKLSGNWQIYTLNLAGIGHEIDSGEAIALAAGDDFYIDDIELTEITDRYYLIKNSWDTPDSCNQDAQGDPYPLYALGCGEYYDRDNTTHYLKSFTYLCNEDAVGCEILIDTHNYSDYNSGIWNSGDGAEVEVDADNFVYAVYDQDKECNQSDKGCQLLGSAYGYANEAIYVDAYLINNPDDYGSILCLEDEAGCEEWTTSEGSSYFKDPGGQACEWGQEYGQAAGSWKWLKKQVNRCDDDGDGAIGAGVETDICLSDSNCPGSISCVLDVNDYACAVNSSVYGGTTIGTGGSVIQILVPDSDGNWAGICPSSEAGCGEYIDPISQFSTNIIFNSDFSQNVDGDAIADGWSAAGTGGQDIQIKSYFLYRFAGKNDDGGSTVSITCPYGIYRLDENNNFNLISAGASYSISLANAGEVKSILFYQSYNQTCEVAMDNIDIGGNDYIELKKAVIDYQLKQDLDKTSCNGIVDFEEGCVLFNERRQDGSDLIVMDYDADLTINDGDGVSPQTGGAAERDANSLIKVTPDRACDKWLACRSYIKDDNDNNVCFDIGLCDSVDDNGSCDSFIITDQIDQTYNTNIQNISNISGYAKVGYGNSSLSADYYPLGAMEQAGGAAVVPNGGFEYYGSNGYPIGWSADNAAWNENRFIAVYDPVSAQAEGAGYAPEGNSFLKLGATYHAVSEWVEVYGGIPYVLSAYINTINLSNGKAGLQISQYNSAGNLISALNDAVTLGAGRDWAYQLVDFTTNANAARIKIKLYSNGSTGNFYFDDIKMKPALNNQDNNYIMQTCRLYPEDDSLSCDYYEDSGARQKGWLGYCLEYDRYPGSLDACLMWYPIDKVNGEGIEEGAGYSGRFPLYYCADTISETGTFRADTVSGSCYAGLGLGDSWCGDLFYGYGAAYNGCCVIDERIETMDELAFNGVGADYTIRTGCATQSPCSDRGTVSFSSDGSTWHKWSTELLNDTTYSIDFSDFGLTFVTYIKFTNITPPGETYPYFALHDHFAEELSPYCSRVVQAVNSVGRNKYWSGRVYQGSDYSFACNTGIVNATCDYLSDYSPFGSIVPGAETWNEAVNPYEWDSSSKAGNQPLYYELPNTSLNEPYQARMGQLHTKDDVKRLFAQSHGAWDWDGSNYSPISGYDWGPPAIICDGASRTSSSNDYCAFLPAISNVEVNNINSNVIITKNGFVNLTFNSDVDSQQLPLVMYAVNWGDDENTTITGVEMLDRISADNPHSLYHLYSYWDMKAKAASGAAGIACAGDCSGYGVSGACCSVKPGVKIKDNWGWCNNGISGNSCPIGGHQAFSGLIVVSEK